jgi:hypothetical protein
MSEIGDSVNFRQTPVRGPYRLQVAAISRRTEAEQPDGPTKPFDLNAMAD